MVALLSDRSPRRSSVSEIFTPSPQFDLGGHLHSLRRFKFVLENLPKLPRRFSRVSIEDMSAKHIFKSIRRCLRGGEQPPLFTDRTCEDDDFWH